jgi:hypothetical protein
MVKKTENDWSNFTFSQASTISGVRKYLDLCQSWLASPKSVTNESKILFCNKKVNFLDETETYLGMHDAEVREVRTFCCYVCKKDSSMDNDGKLMVANPFTRAQLMLLCGDCNRDILSYR